MASVKVYSYIIRAVQGDSNTGAIWQHRTDTYLVAETRASEQAPEAVVA